MGFFIEVLINGLLVGIMYALVAMGFALIYKASDVFNLPWGIFVYLPVWPWLASWKWECRCGWPF